MGYDSTEAELPAFLAQLRLLPAGAERAALLESGERLGRWALPTYLACLERAAAGELAVLWNTLTRMVVAEHHAHERLVRGVLRTSDLALGQNRFEVRELLWLYRATLGRKEQGATRCRARCAEVLLERGDDRARAAPIFREHDVESWLAVRWDEALEANDHAQLWEQVAVWLCGPEEVGTARLIDALMQAPEEDRWSRVLQAAEWCVDDFQRATKRSPELFRWAEARTLALIAEQPRSDRIPALVGMLGGSTALAPHVLPILNRVSLGHRAEACVINHALHTPGLRAPIFAALEQQLGFRNPVEVCRIALAIGASFPAEIGQVLRAALPTAIDPDQLRNCLARLERPPPG